MSILQRVTGLFSRKPPKKVAPTAERSAGAGPALAAHSKDASAKGASGQNRRAAKKRTH